MAATALIQARIDPEIKEKAAAVFERSGLTVSDVMRIVLTRAANEGVIPLIPDEPMGFDAWFRERVRKAMDDPRPRIPDEAVDARFTKRRDEAFEPTGQLVESNGFLVWDAGIPANFDIVEAINQDRDARMRHVMGLDDDAIRR